MAGNSNASATPPPATTPTTTSLNATRRRRELARLADGDVVDVLVVGLGVTGAGVALDAASRGLSVAAVEAHDLAFGTSRWSSKLVHGGLRYLANGDVAVAHECARERGLLMTRLAPHLTRALPFVLPLTPALSRSAARLYRAGVHAGDALRMSAGTSGRLLPRSRRLTVAETLRWAPGVRAGGLRGGQLNWDGQLEDDARLVTAIARTAAGLGARILTRCRALTLGADGGTIRDELTGQTLTVRARSVVNAAGVWAGDLVEGVDLRPSRGTHLVLRAEALGGPSGRDGTEDVRTPAGLMVPVPGARARYVFALPQPDGLVYVGLTDEAVEPPVPDEPVPPESDIAFLLDTLGAVLTVPVRREDVVGAFCGLRPLLADRRGGGSDSSRQHSDLSRRHAILTSPSGVITVVGGKLTTYRRMAADAVTVAVRAARIAAGPSRTSRLPLVGAATRATLAGIDAPPRLIRRYGAEAPAVAALATADPTLAEPLADGVDVTGAELVWALRHELALNLDDLLDRRTRLGLVPTQRTAAAPAAERILAAHPVSSPE